MNLEIDIQQGEKLLSQMNELVGQIQMAWQDSIAWDFMKKYTSLCDVMKKDVKKLSGIDF